MLTAGFGTSIRFFDGADILNGEGPDCTVYRLAKRARVVHVCRG